MTKLVKCNKSGKLDNLCDNCAHVGDHEIIVIYSIKCDKWGHCWNYGDFKVKCLHVSKNLKAWDKK